MSTRKPITKMACDDVNKLVYGTCANPLTTKSGMVIGGGEVYPELNFTLPSMTVNKDTIQEAYNIYREMVTDAVKRANELYCPGICVEYEALPEFTDVPEWGIEVTKIIVDVLQEYNVKHGMKNAMRATPNDMREMSRPPIMRSGHYWEGMLKFFEGCGKVGADFISIESTGGKEIHDDALINCNIQHILLSLGVMAAIDMQFLWGTINDITDKYDGIVSAGDSSCGFANTAMTLGCNNYIPRTFAAVSRVCCVPRAMLAYEMGSTGPSKDCEYAGGYLKAITGYPVAMEGRMACAAHLTPMGNIAAALPDLWSNESVQQVMLLSTMAPTVGMEQLIYDCRMLNVAKAKGQELLMRDILVDSDAPLDVMAYVMRPDVIIEVSKKFVGVEDPYLRTKAAILATIDALRKGINDKRVACADRDAAWLDIMESQINDTPDNGLELWDRLKNDPALDQSKFIAAEYGLK